MLPRPIACFHASSSLAVDCMRPRPWLWIACVLVPGCGLHASSSLAAEARCQCATRPSVHGQSTGRIIIALRSIAGAIALRIRVISDERERVHWHAALLVRSFS
jgi:hypothetical protein